MFAMFFLVYHVVAIPPGVVFAVVLARALARRHAAGQAVAIATAWTTGLFTPLVVPASGFFGNVYAPWYLAWTIAPPTPGFSPLGLLVTAGVALAASAATASIVRRGQR